MTNPSRTVLLLMLFVSAFLSGCLAYGRYDKGYGLRMGNWSPLLIREPTPIPAPPAPDDTVYDPLFEDALLVVDWARPVAPENSANALFTPDGHYLIYLALHPGTRLWSLYSTPLAGGTLLAGGKPIELDRGRADEEFFYPTITHDSKRVVYYTFDREGLYSISITGTKEIVLSNDSIWEVRVSPDAQWAVYWGRENGSNEEGLYSVPIAGGTPIWLGNGLPQIESYQITPDSRYVLSVHVKEGVKGDGINTPIEPSGRSFELYRVPIQGGPPVQLSQGESSFGSLTVLVTPDSQTVIYGNLYTVPMEGGTPLQLNHAADANQFPSAFSSPPQLSPDGRWLLFLAGDPGHNNVSLFATPMAGGPTVQLNGPLAEGESVSGFTISADSQRALYWQGQRGMDGLDKPLYSVELAGGTPILVPGGNSMQSSPDGAWILSFTKLETPGFDVYSISTAGGLPIKLNSSVPTDSAVGWAIISPDSRSVFYATSKDPGGGMPIFNGLYQVPITGGEAREITGVDGQDRVFGFFFAPDGQTLLANVDYDGDGRSALYAFTPAPLPAPQR